MCRSNIIKNGLYFDITTDLFKNITHVASPRPYRHFYLAAVLQEGAQSLYIWGADMQEQGGLEISFLKGRNIIYSFFTVCLKSC